MQVLTTFRTRCRELVLAADYQKKTLLTGLFVLLTLLTQAQTLTLPIEVLGAQGTIQTVSVSVPNGNTATSLWLQANNLSYDNKASVRVNNGAWIDLNNNTCDVAEPSKSYGGIGGAHNTIKLKVALPAGTVQNGTNQISFRFNQSDGVSIGYRIVKLNFLNPSGSGLIPASGFTNEDPATWQAPRPGASDVIAGKQLWESAVLNESYLANARVLQAKCGDCHARDGRDLKYFNYSNTSIIERAKYHGLSATQAEQIASYIRKLTVPAPATARPWNPPYQPGPGQDSRPLVEWSAGAGIDAVLDDDRQSLPFLFPNGVTPASVATSSTMNIREIPVSIQLLDWKHWLPVVHPKDAWGSAFVNSKLNKKYNGEGNGSATYNLRQRIGNGAQSYILAQYGTPGMQADFADWEQERSMFLNPRTEPADQIPWTRDYAVKVYSTAQWQAVKFWEMMQEFNLEGLGPQMYGAKSEARTWPGIVRHVFEASPHRLHIPILRDDLAANNKAINNIYLSNAWYHTQMVLSTGNRSGNGFNPVDWAYLHGLVKDLNVATNGTVTELARMLMIVIKGAQEADNGKGPEDPYNGWNLMRNYSPGALVLDGWEPMWQEVDPGTKKQILDEYLRTWLAKSRSYPISQYKRSMNEFDIPPTTYIPVVPPPGAGNAADRVWTMIPQMRSAGVDCALLNDIIDFAQSLWPNANWASLRVANCPTQALRTPENPANTLAGVEHSYYEGNWTALPNFSALAARQSGNLPDVSIAGSQRINNFAFRFKGYIQVPTDGLYQFSTASDDGSQVFIGSEMVVDNDGPHGVEERVGTIGLKAGKHAITVTYFDAGGTKQLTLNYAGPNMTKRRVPASALFRVDPSAPQNPLPVSLVRFAAERKSEGVQLNWTTATELNNARFDVQRSSDGREFGTVAVVEGQGTTNQAHQYASLDRKPLTGLTYYRLRQVDTNGAAAFSPTVTVAPVASISLYPNPARTELNLVVPAASATYRVRDAVGRVLRQGTAAQGTAVLDVSALRAGLYHLELTTPAGRTVHKFVKED